MKLNVSLLESSDLELALTFESNEEKAEYLKKGYYEQMEILEQSRLRMVSNNEKWEIGMLYSGPVYTDQLPDEDLKGHLWFYEDYIQLVEWQELAKKGKIVLKNTNNF